MRDVLARERIVLRSCADHAASGLSTPVDKRVDVRAESVSAVRPGETQGAAPTTTGRRTVDRGMEDVVERAKRAWEHSVLFAAERRITQWQDRRSSTFRAALDRKARR